MVRSEHAPLRIEPQRGQVSENSSEPSSSEHWGVLHEHETGSYLANDPSKLGPESAFLAVDAGAFSSRADVLARETARHDINSAFPLSSVKGSHVIPDRERFETPVVLAGHEYVSAVGVELDGADGSPSEQLSAKDASTSAREKCQLTHASPVVPPTA